MSASLPKNITHLDLGCGPIGQRVEWWVGQGIHKCAGVDTDLSDKNEDFATLSRINVVRKVDTRIGAAPMPKVATRTAKAVRKRLFQIDALKALQSLPDNKLKVVNADVFFRNIPDSINDIVSEIHRVLKKGGEFMCIEDNIDLVLEACGPGMSAISRARDFACVTDQLLVNSLSMEMAQREGLERLVVKKIAAAR